MKKYIISPICSAVIVPGTGQVLNGQIKKGLILMGIVFVFIVALVIRLAQLITKLLPSLDPENTNAAAVLEKMNTMDITILEMIISAFIIIWIYSIIDAFIVGLKVEREGKQQ